MVSLGLARGVSKSKQKACEHTRTFLTEIDQAKKAPEGYSDGFWSFRGEDATARIPVNGPVSLVLVDSGVHRSTNLPVHYRSTNSSIPVDTGPKYRLITVPVH